MADARRRVIVHGAVQGVAFRDSTARLARRRGVAGYVANRPDGTVEAVFEGPEADVESLVEFSRRGPRLARVDHIEVTEESPQGVTGFDIR